MRPAPTGQHPASQPVGEPGAQAPPPAAQLRDAGQRIEALLNASSTAGTAARERAEELVRLVVDLYGAGLARMLDVLYDAGRLDDQALAALAGDELVASLLLVHGLHPDDLPTRVEQALAGVRPYLGSHGGDVELVEVTEAGVVRLRLLGNCDGCPSSSATLTLAVEKAITEAAPDLTAIEVVPAEAAPPGGGLISIGSLRSRLAGAAPAGASAGSAAQSSWHPVPELAELAAGEVRTFITPAGGVVACRAGLDLFAYLDRCPHCTASLAGATLGRRMGAEAAAAVLLCPSCRAHYDIRRAGASLDYEGEHLDPLPLLARDGVLSLALRDAAETVGPPVNAVGAGSVPG